MLVWSRHGGSLGQVLLPAAGQLIGRVRDASGNALTGVTIDVASAIKDFWGFQSATIRAGARSDNMGIFRVPCVPRTGLTLTASKPGYATVKQTVGQGSAIALTLEPRGFVTGKVVDANSKPVPDANVYASTAAALIAAPRGTTTGPDGTFRITAPPANLRYRITANERSGKYRSFSSNVQRGAQQNVVVTTLADTPNAPRQLTVLAHDALTGAPLPTFSIATVSTTYKWRYSLRYRASSTRTAKEAPRFTSAKNNAC